MNMMANDEYNEEIKKCDNNEDLVLEKPMLNTEQQIEHLKKKGITFNICSEEEAYKYLNNNGTLALEIGYNQKDKVINLIKASNMYKDIYSKKDLSNNDRIVVSKKRSN